MMNQCPWMVLAYFGPEVQLPLTSLLGAAFGFAMLFGRELSRVTVGSYRAISRRLLRRGL
jgi:hypothetical protein